MDNQIKEPIIRSSIKFGEYNNNNRTRAQYDAWNQSWNDFANSDYEAGFQHIFAYLLDEQEQNLQYKIENEKVHFQMYQGSAKLHGIFDGQILRATVVITRLENISTVIMRKLLDRNQGLLYSRIALDDGNQIILMMDMPLDMMTSATVYSGLRELLLTADELDDYLINTFGQAVSLADKRLKQAIPEEEARIKFRYFKKWIAETLTYLQATNRSDLHGIATYLPLSLIHRVHYLCAPKGLLQEKLREISRVYWEHMQLQKTGLPAVLQNQAKLIRELDEMPEATFYSYLYRTRDSFSGRGAVQQKEIEGAVRYSIDEVRDTYNRSFPAHAYYTLEYPIGNLVFDFNVPYLLTALYHLQMMVLHRDFFEEIGVAQPVFEEGTDVLNRGYINEYIEAIIAENRELFPRISFNVTALSYEDGYQLCLSIATETANMIPTLN